ncbi:MAG: alpha,alpha-trehalase TreF [Saprospiraceae bacterium]
MKHQAIYFGLLFILMSACQQPGTEPMNPPSFPKKELSPDQRFGELFVAVQLAQLFPDGKTFVDCTPKQPADDILAAYNAQKQEANFDLKAFVLAHFELPKQYDSGFSSDTSRAVSEHINLLWDVLTREPEANGAGSLIPLPKPYIVPGGRFREVYYWDSYFTMLGLQAAGKVEMIENMVDNFAYLIDTIGFIPNGNRTYYVTRSQPPFFAAMVQLLADVKGKEVIAKYLPQLVKEYAFWMQDADKVSANAPTQAHVVRLKDGAILNRYWDSGNSPRPESYREDVKTAEISGRPKAEIYRDLRAGATSGWDYSSRWFADGISIATVQTTAIIPVDLNALLYNLELTIARAYELRGDEDNANLYDQRAGTRRDALMRYCWNEELGFFFDYNFQIDQQTGIVSLAAAYPLFFNMVRPEQAKAIASVIEDQLLQAGGVVSTLNETGEQWDAPNGWAPLQWITIKGLRNYSIEELATKISDRWIALNTRVYQNTGKMVEKYNVMDMSLNAGGGEYPLQDGFGWSNGVLLTLLKDKK